MKTIDAKGKLCPQPLIMAKKALVEMKENETLQVLIDNETSKNNVVRYLKDNEMEVQWEKENEVFELLVVKKGGKIEKSNPEEYCEIEPVIKGKYVVCIEKNRMGEGEKELGELLIKGFINTLPDAPEIPGSLIFYNSGVKLVIEGSPVVEALNKLKNLGVEIIACGTCLDYYDVMNKLVVAEVSNMYDIIERKVKASKIIYP